MAELYDRARPSYPAALVDDVLAFSRASAPDRALEVGAGTGKATALFAERGLSITALEPSSEMAAVARRNCAGYDNVAIEESDFEHWRIDRPGSFRLLFSAQAWHWVSPEIGYARASEALQPGGALALFWNTQHWETCALRDELIDAYQGTVPDFGPDPGPGHPATATTPDQWSDWQEALQDAVGFSEPAVRSYTWTARYTANEYVQLLQTHSDHIVLADDRRAALLAAVADAIELGGGTLELEYATLLCLARAAASREP